MSQTNLILYKYNLAKFKVDSFGWATENGLPDSAIGTRNGDFHTLAQRLGACPSKLSEVALLAAPNTRTGS